VTISPLRAGLLVPLFVLPLVACATGVTDAPAHVDDQTEPGPGTAAEQLDAASPSTSDASDAATAPRDAGDPQDAAISPDATSPDAGPGTDAGQGTDASDAAVVVAPVVDGTIGPNEYGSDVNGENQQASPGVAPTTTWHMTWTDSYLYVGVSAANVAEGLVLYVETAPLSPSTSGTNADGSLAGTTYDGTKAASLPFRADFVAYVKNTYQEHRSADGANGWSAAVTSGLTVQGTGAVREIAIPWTAIRAAGRPSSFSWLGYVTSPGGYVYGQMPTANPGGNVGTTATLGYFYRVADATPGAPSETKPFAVTLSP
jgi:hypothetical protein